MHMQCSGKTGITSQLILWVSVWFSLSVMFLHCFLYIYTTHTRVEAGCITKISWHLSITSQSFSTPTFTSPAIPCEVLFVLPGLTRFAHPTSPLLDEGTPDIYPYMHAWLMCTCETPWLCKMYALRVPLVVRSPHLFVYQDTACR